MSRNFRLSSVRTNAQRGRPETVKPRKTVALVPSGTAPVAPKDARLYRAWSESNEWLRAAINHRKTQVSGAPWDISPIDGESDYDHQAQMEISALFHRPNTKTDSFRLFVEEIIEDIMVLDAGTTEIVRNLRGKPVQLWPSDGASIRVSRIWQGNPDEPRYYWAPNGQIVSALLDRDLMYIMQNPSTYRALGLPPPETLRETIDAEMAAARFNKGQVTQAPPQGIIDLGEDATPANVEQFEQYWRAEIAGAKATAIMGGTKGAKFIPFARSQRDMQYLQWQTYLIRKIAAVYGISPQDLGIMFDVNRANAEVQSENSEDRGLRPLINLLENHFNREVIGDWTRMQAKQKYWAGDYDHYQMKQAIMMSYFVPDTTEKMAMLKAHPDINPVNLRFRFKIPSGRSGRARADIHKLELGGMPWDTINRVRDEELLDPVEGGDEIWVMTPVGPMRLSAIDGTKPLSPAEQKFFDLAFANPKWVLGDQYKPIDTSTVPVATE